MEYPKHIVAVGALVRNNNNQVLLVKTERRGWELPGGQVEEGEDILSAIHREILEESGITIQIVNLTAYYSSIDYPCKLIIDFIAENVTGTAKAAIEILEVSWFSPEEASAQVTNPVMLYRLKWLLSYKNGIRYSYYSKTPFKPQSEIIF